MFTWGFFRVAVAVIVALAGITGESHGDDREREAYLQRRAQEKAAAEKAVAELTDLGKLSNEDLIRLALAYNELGDNTRSFDAINRVPESYLAEKGKLDIKNVALINVKSSLDDDKACLLHLAFLDRCIDRRYDNLGLWYFRKARLLCRMSVAKEFPNRNIIVEQRIIDREQYEYAYETLKRAFEAEPNLLRLKSAVVDILFIETSFPILSSEARFKKLMGK